MAGAPVADPVLPPTETEAPTTEEVVESAAPEVDEAAAPESPTEPTPEAPAYVTEDRLAEIRREERDQARRDAVEEVRRENQRRGALEAAQRKADEEATALAVRETKVALWEAGYTDAEPDKVAGVVKSLVSAQKDQITRSTVSEIAQGLVVAYAEATGIQVPDDIQQSDGVLVRSAQLKSYVSDIIQNAKELAKQELVASGQYVPVTKVPRLEAAVQKDENQQTREGQRPYNSPAGEPAGSDELTPDKYASMTPSQIRALQKDNPQAIDAMYAKYVSTPQKA